MAITWKKLDAETMYLLDIWCVGEESAADGLRLPKCAHAPMVQLMPWLAIRSLMKSMKHANPLPSAPIVGV
jgi:hypothetical protein